MAWICGLAVVSLLSPWGADAEGVRTSEHGGVVLEGSRDARPERLHTPFRETEDQRRLRRITPPVLRSPVPDVKGLAAQAVQGRQTKAITGDTILFLGTELRLIDLNCPTTNTPDGRRAKALMNTFLRRAGHFSCAVSKFADGQVGGRCEVAERKGLKGQDIAASMVETGLCHAGPWAKREDV